MKLLTTKETAERLRVSLPTLYKLCAIDGFPAVRFGRAIRIDEQALDNWILANTGKDVLEEVQ